MKKSTIILTLMLLNLAAVFGQTNVALGKIFYSTYFNQDVSAVIGRIVDGNNATFANLPSGNSGYFILDLGSICSISSIKLKFGTNIPTTLTISSSLVSYSYFTTLATPSVTSNAITTVVNMVNSNQLNQHRYIKVSFNCSQYYSADLYEMEVYGTQCTTLTYAYDAHGNRISRTIILPPQVLKSATAIYDSTAQALKKEFIPENTLTDAVGESKVSIYPNPTRGELVVQVSNPSTNDQTRKIMLYDLKGMLIYLREDASEYTDVDITNKPSGVYILKIYNGTESTTWKIIKQ